MSLYNDPIYCVNYPEDSITVSKDSCEGVMTIKLIDNGNVGMVEGMVELDRDKVKLLRSQLDAWLLRNK